MRDIEAEIEEFERKGFWFLPEWTMDEPVVGERIRFPDGKILPVEEILDKNGFEEATRYYDLIRELDADERYSKYDFSFWGEGDLQNNTNIKNP